MGLRSTSRPRPDLEAHDAVVRMDDERVAKELKNLLGARLVAYVGNVTETRAVREWIEGSRKMRPDTARRLRVALQAGWMIEHNDSPRVTQAWFQGLNPQLVDWSPARLLREGDIDKVGPQVIEAARAFVIGG
jgi:hypothetical protein